MGERVNKVKEMIDEHESSFESLKESTKQFDEQINQYELENKQKDMHIERLTEERDTYAKDDRILLEEYNKSIEQTEKEKEENIKAKEELEDKKSKLEKEVEEKMESFTRHDAILRQLTQEGMQIDTEIMQVKFDMQANLYRQQTFKLEYDQDGNPTNGMDLAQLDKEYKDLTDQLRELNEAKALCQEYIQKYHDELDNDAKRKYAIENESPEQESPEQESPEQELSKQEPPKQEPSKQEPPKQEPPKPVPPKQETPKQNPPKQEKTLNINAYAEKIYEKMSPNQRNEIYKFMTGQIRELGENTKPIFDKIQELYGADVEQKIERHIKQMSAKEFLKVTGIKTDVTTGMITIDFNCGEKFKPVRGDVTIFGRNEARMYSVKDAQKLADSKCKFDETIADPYVVSALAQATRTQLVKLGLSEEQISEIDIQKQVDLYQEALTTSKDVRPEDKKLDMNIEYVKSNEEKPIKAGRKKFEKVLRPFLREAKESAYVKIDDSIDTRTGIEKIKDALSFPWRWLTGKDKLLSSGEKGDKTEDDKLKDNDLTNVARTLGIEAQMNIVNNIPTGEIDEDLTKEQEEKLNDMLREHAENRNMEQQAPIEHEAEPNAERDDDDGLEI